jgi:hypothetical protein
MAEIRTDHLTDTGVGGKIMLVNLTETGREAADCI